MSVEQLEAARTPRTKVLLMCSPSNPTGSVYTPEELTAFADTVLQEQILGARLHWAEEIKKQ